MRPLASAVSDKAFCQPSPASQAAIHCPGSKRTPRYAVLYISLIRGTQMVNGVRLQDIPREVIADVGRAVSDFTIGFAAVQEDDVGQRVTLGGSGTLVQVNDTYGILTAHHVLRHLPDTPEIGLIIATRFDDALPHRPTLRREAVQHLPIARGGNDAEGPDLGILILSHVDANSLSARKSFYNLAVHRAEVRERPPALNEGVWLLCGFAAEQTVERVSERGFAREVVFRGPCGAGWVEREYADGDFDYLDFEARYGGADEPPQSFGGFSGTGLWQARLTRTPAGALAAERPLLSGVAFFQSDRAQGLRVIKCHGRRSVYDRVPEAIRAAL